ncbi:MAG: mechanosensitive ion channel family protein [Cyanobacteriota bacterium]|nr:mechanosensitive ion channel family protein [Cyanobacteriota bacterium]
MLNLYLIVFRRSRSVADATSILKGIISRQTKAINFLIVSILTFALVISLNPLAFGQTNDLLSPNTEPNKTANSEIVYAPIILDGRELFQIAAMAGSGLKVGTNNPASPIEMRVKMYEESLQQILESGFDAASLDFSVEKGEEQNLIVVNDGEQLNSRPLIAVTKLDAQIHGLSESDLANELIAIIKPALVRAQIERSSDYLNSQFVLSGAVIFGAVLGSFLLIFMQKKLLEEYKERCQQERELERRITDNKNLEGQENKSDKSSKYSESEAAEKQQLIWERQQNINSFLRGLLQITHIMFWLGAITWILGRFPQTRSLQDMFVTKEVIVAIALATYLAIKACVVLIDWLLKKWLERQSMTSKRASRIAARITTVSHVAKGLLAVALASIGIIGILQELDIPIGPVLAGAGIIGFAISFSSQNLIRDVINGALVLLEDQYALGDIINVGHASGVVEKINLRMTQLRGVDGRLSTVSNSSIHTVHNLTKDWSRINFTVEVDYDSDVTEALEIVKEVSKKLDQDAEWGERVLEPVDILGVNNLSHAGIEIAIWIRTLPGFQWSVAREFRRRLKIAFDEAGIPIGVPQRSLLLQSYPTMFGGDFDADIN